MRIAMVCDFFFPQAGGIEIHILQIAKQLISRGHHVIVITHAYGDRSGVRYMSHGLKVYYVPFLVIYRESTIPTLFTFFPLFRQIMLRERIEIVHGHASMSALCHECIVHARTMGLATVFTDHSLFEFSNLPSILVNKVMKFVMTDVDHVIGVSHTSRENTVLRAALDPAKTSAIPNAVVSEEFEPRKSGEKLTALTSLGIPPAKDSEITLVVCSRLYANKGADLLVSVIPQVCAAEPNLRVLIAGNGPKIVDLQQMCEQRSLQDRVHLVGAIRHDQVRDFMVCGEIYLHSALTEAFGTVIVEAASCGLLVVTTNVGGIPEVLPDHMTVYADPAAKQLTQATLRAVNMVRKREIEPKKFHTEIKQMYHWQDVAVRTEKVYERVKKNSMGSTETLMDRIQRHYQCGFWAGKVFVLSIVADTLLLFVLNWLKPASQIDIAPDWSAHDPSLKKKTLT